MKKNTSNILIISVLCNIILICLFVFFYQSTQDEDTKNLITTNEPEPITPENLCTGIDDLENINDISTLLGSQSLITNIGDLLVDNYCESVKGKIITLLKEVRNFDEYQIVKNFFLLDDGASYMIFLNKNYSQLSDNMERIMEYEGEIRSYKYLPGGLTKSDFVKSHLDLVKYSDGKITEDIVRNTNGNDIYIYVSNENQNSLEEMTQLCVDLGIDSNKCIGQIQFFRSNSYQECMDSVKDEEMFEMCYRYL